MARIYACEIEWGSSQVGRTIKSAFWGTFMSNNSAALRRFFLGGAAVGAMVLSAGAAWAQTPPASTKTPPPVDQTKPAEPPAKPAERIIITGSRIAQDAYTSASPIEVITSESATLAGVIDTAGILQGATVASGSTQLNNSFGSFVTEGGTGTNTVSLRGLGSQRSLVLLNGNRPGPAGTRGQVGAFDLNTVPDSIISRVEILKDGASSIYDSDAVAGVANIITRTSVDHPELTVQYNNPERRGGSTFEVNGAFGLNFANGNVVFAGQYEKIDALQYGDRGYSRCNQDIVTDPATGARLDRQDHSILQGTSLAGCSNIYFNTVIDAIGGTRYVPSPNGVTVGPFPGYRPRANKTFLNSPDGTAYYEDVLNDPRYLTGYFLDQQERTSLYEHSNISFGGIDWTTEALFTNRQTTAHNWRQFFPQIANAAGYDVPGPFTTPNSFAARGPFRVAQPVTLWPSNQSINVKYYYLTTGLKGGFGSTGYLSNWSWSVDANYSRSDGTYEKNEIKKETAGDWNYASADGLYHGPTYNPFDPNFLAGNYSKATFDLLTGYSRGKTTYDQTTVTAGVTGDLFRLPAGPVGLAVGAEYRTFKINDTPDQGSIKNLYWGTTSAGITKGKDTVTEEYAEVKIPVLKGLPGVEELTVDGSGRWFNYDSYGSNNVWKAGINWQVIPMLRFRGTKGTSYRAPALYELYLGNQTGFLSQTSIDPCINWGNSTNVNIVANCSAAGIPATYAGAGSSATVTTGGGLGTLKAEDSESSTLGVIFTPSFLDLSIAIDYFDITVFNEVATLNAATILGGCYGAPVFPNAFCSFFNRNPGTGVGPYNITTVNANYINVNQQATHGIDYNVRYEHEFNFGKVLVDLKATQTMEDVKLLFNPNIASGFNTNDFNGSSGDPKWVGDAEFQLKKNDITYTWFTHYVGATDNKNFANPQILYQGRTVNQIITASDWWSHDLSVRWQGDHVTITGGIQNIFDAQPPILSSNGGAQRLQNIALAGTQYDYLGRTFFFRVGNKF